MHICRYLFLAALALCAVLPASAETRARTVVEGTASVIDGDTIEIHGEEIRLHGFDTPETGSRCGEVNVYQKAALALADFIGTQTVTCEIWGEGHYRRRIGTCRAGGLSLAGYMVERGWGLACPADLWGARKYD